MKHATPAWTAALAVVTGLAAVLVGGCAQWGAGEEGAVPPPPLAPAMLDANAMAVQWQSKASLAPDTHLVDVWVRGDFVVLHGSDHRVYVLDAESGLRLWSADLAKDHETLWPPAAHRGRLWFVTTTSLMGFRGSDGRNVVEEVLRPAPATPAEGEEAAEVPEEEEPPAGPRVSWPGSAATRRRVTAEIGRIERRQDDLARLLERPQQAIPLDFAPSGPPATNGSHVFIPDAKGWLQAVSLRPDLVSWGRWTDGAVTAGPVVDGARVYFAGHNGSVYASAQNIRRIIWQYQTEGAIRADLRLTDTGMVLASSTDYSLYAFNGASGALEWDQLPNRRYHAGEPIRKPPYTFGEQIFLFTDGAGLTVLNTTTGKAQWQLKDGLDLITADADTVYVLGRGNDVLAVNRASGQVRFAIPLRGGTRIGINETGTGLLYFASPQGYVWAIARDREAETPAEVALLPGPAEAAAPAAM
ncbi:MAG: PQQ-binding-like beta-propeller repeat protein [Phycisphaerae bacterium]